MYEYFHNYLLFFVRTVSHERILLQLFTIFLIIAYEITSISYFMCYFDDYDHIIFSSRRHRRWDEGSYGFYLRFFLASSFAYNFVRK